MVDLLVRQSWSPQQIKLADTARAEFKRNRFTSGSAHLDDLITLGKAIILCDSHMRKFNAKAARYTLHPSKNLRRVLGNCDVCKMHGLGALFLNEKDAFEERKKLEQFKRAIEYGNLFNG